VPRYDYDCAACGTRFEVVHGVHADPPSACPSCGGGPIKKAFAPPTIHFKGSGWAKKERRATATPGRTATASPGGATPSAAGGGGGESGGADGPSAASTGGEVKPSAAPSTATGGD
jgi:putative FmdB family regulatory protein